MTEVQSFFIGLVIGVGGIMGFLFNFDSTCSRYTAAIEQCEVSLPRNQHCEITAVPAQEQP